jgi:hypothetical protein
MPQNRRQFLRTSSAFAAGFAGLQRYIAAGELEATNRLVTQDDVSYGIATANSRQPGVGPLTADPNGLLDLPAGFSYRIESRVGDTMHDGFLTPGAPDGMATFRGPQGLTIILRNHEVYPSQQGPFGQQAELLDRLDQKLLYDLGVKGKPCIGGTTTIVYDTKHRQLVKQFLSLTGTVRNCAGGPTPWGTWITCEEATDRPGLNTYNGVETVCEKYHGYNFEVPANAHGGLNRAVPLRAMGRFRHEAVAVEPASGIVFQTEDVDDGLIYRFIPNNPGVLADGGKLQALAIGSLAGADTRNWTDELPVKIGEQHDVRWIDLDDVESPENDLRYRGFEAGAARFARGEGMWFADGNIYFACTTGGAAQLGQIWKYTPSQSEGLAAESANPGTLELFIEPNNSKLIANADNLTAAPWGDLVVCEDRDGDEVRLVGVTPAGKCYTLAHNHAQCEFAGVCFSPDGSTLFVNLQREGLTLAITGPWPRRDA